jgi:hypothetical protein
MLSHIRSRKILLFSCPFHVAFHPHVEFVRAHKPLHRSVGSSLRERVRRIILVMDPSDFSDLPALIGLAKEHHIDHQALFLRNSKLYDAFVQ